MTKKSNNPSLTEKEQIAIQTSADLAKQMREIIGDGPNAYHDWTEFTIHIHAVQNMILSQAAARAYPNDYRLLGEKLPPLEEANDVE